MAGLTTDVRVAIRQHLRRPGFALAVLCTLAITTGATMAVFSIVNGVLLRALPFASPERLVWIASVRPDNPSAPFTLPEFMDYRRQTRTLAGLAAYANWSASLAGDGVTERLQGARMSANAFEILGIRAVAGRLLNEHDDAPDAPMVVLISYRLWQRQFGGTMDIAGRTARINGESFTIAGVLPAQFPLPLRDIDVVTPLVPDRDPLRHARSSVNFLRFFGRLDARADSNQAQTELTAICRSLREQFPVEYARKDAVRVAPLRDAIVGEARQSLFLLLGAVAVVLATALANLVSLALVRATGRRTEMAMRIALGASRLQIARQLAVEALVLAAAGTAAGSIIAVNVIGATVRWGPSSLPRLDEAGLDGIVVLFAAGITALVTALLTAAPLAAVWRASGEALRSTSRSATGDRVSRHVRQALVIAEIAASVVLLLATTVLIQNLRRLDDVHLGFEPDGVFQARVSLPSTYRSPGDVTRFYEQLFDRIGATPGVTRAGVISIAPLSGLLATVPFLVEGQPVADRDRSSANLRAISPDYLATVATRLVQGRGFSEADRSDTPPVALVSQALADRFLSGAPLGQRLMIDDNNEGPRPVAIVGVVENVRLAALDLPATFDIYLPLRQTHPDGVSFVRNNQFWMVRTESNPASFRSTFLTHLRAVDADAAVSSMGTMRQYLDAWLGPRRFDLGLVGAFALTGILLAISGLYGLVAYTVDQRTREIALRMAIGATPRDVSRLILRQAVALGAAGAAGGLALGVLLQPLVARLVPDARPGALVIGAATTSLIAVVLAAAWLPARRAARIEPTRAL